MRAAKTTREAQQQFEQLFQRSRHRAYRLAYRLTGNATDAEDVTQDAYVRAWHHFDRYDSNYSFEAWLFRIVTNRGIDLQRRRKRAPIYSLDTHASGEETGLLPVNETVAPNNDTEQIVFGLIGEERLLKAVDTLPDHYRLAIRLYAVEQRSYEEIAETMRCALGTARSRIHRARGLLRHYIEAGERSSHRGGLYSASELDVAASST
jgi:RNA polymerase sigma-70 factor (ECF subfamily)